MGPGDIQIGEDFDLCSAEVSYEMSFANNGPQLTFHTDRTLAEEMGFPEAIVAGPHIMTVVSEGFTDLLGRGWIEGGKLSLKYIRTTLLNEPFTVKARATNRADEHGRARIEFELTGVGSDGTTRFVGNASGYLDA